MGTITLFMHISLDGFAAGPNGEMDWIHVDEEIFDYGATRIFATDTALYGRKTFQMMEGYWPTAADQPNASKHDVEHAAWYKTAKKFVLSNTLEKTSNTNIRIIRGNLVEEINQVKQSTEKEILLFGSPSVGHALLELDLIDGFWLNVNPVILGAGIPVFKNVKEKRNLSLVGQKVFKSGVVCLDYKKTK